MRERSLGSKVFDAANHFVLLLVGIVTVLPFLYVISGSLVSSEELLVKKVVLIPTHISWDAYRYIFSSKIIYQSLLNTVFITVVGTFINLLLTTLMAYPLAKKKLRGRNKIMLMIVITMLFNGGMIPTYLVVKSLGMLDTYWSLWLPIAISAFNLVLLRNFFQQLPEELEESAKIDGCNDLRILYRIVVPLSLPAMATFALFYAVGHWNSYFSAVIYINNSNIWPIQVWLRQIVMLSTGGFTDANALSEVVVPPESIKYAVIVVAAVPVLLLYPFLQKHFAKGVLLGSVKG
ncbi:putative aldouronate transport system permease protein [Paenibacillus rhizosphaerae]|uniref:Putative aldouronate transport system permease protein n=1 Tax=Paenibacillus rhizosphaerae TaxID=297318 RepID=A0A839TSY3_9BACL|nr:carbohydrate ABC transporter permease [Paenibacillus rhizosphaerae]MBB3128498.1 putative aldouronate transport system permease protein [Paenibacillus rhizosphaerae]